MSPASEEGSPRANRSIVTEEALFVAPDVLGLPLAGPWRRGAAIAADGVFVSILANAPSVLFGFAAAYVLFRVSGRKKAGSGYIRRSFRFMFRAGGALVLFLVAVSLWGSIGERIRGDGGDDAEDSDFQATVSMEEDDLQRDLNLTALQTVQFGTQAVELHTAESGVEAEEAAADVLQLLRDAGLSGEEARQAVRGVVEGEEARPWLMPAVERALSADAARDPPRAPGAAVDSTTEPEPDSIVVTYAAAIAAEDSAAIDSLRPTVVSMLAADTVGVLSGTITSLREDRDALREEVEELEAEVETGPGLLATLGAFAEDLGLGLGWFGLYFTATTAMWQGRTPGKRLLGIRVISLTGKPIGWWSAFERFGGYAAGFATGLLGFAQILWDDNRQAIHDKIAVTAVIRENLPNAGGDVP